MTQELVTRLNFGLSLCSGCTATAHPLAQPSVPVLLMALSLASEPLAIIGEPCLAHSCRSLLKNLSNLHEGLAALGRGSQRGVTLR